MSGTRFKHAIAAQVARISGLSEQSVLNTIVRSKVKGHGVFSIPVMRLRQLQQQQQQKQESLHTDVQLIGADEIGKRFDTSGLIPSVDMLPNYLNFGVNTKVYIQDTITDVISTSTTIDSISGNRIPLSTSSYGMDPSVGAGRVIAIDFSSPNIAKPFHGGHLRGTILGSFVSRILRGFGYKVVGINYLGDWGKQYGLMAVGFDKYGDRELLKQDPIKHLYDVYVKVNKAIEAEPELDKKANEYFKRMEDGDTSVLGLWQEFRSLSIDFYRIMYKRLGIEFDIYSGESESAKWVPQAYSLLSSTGLLQTQEDGSLVVDLSKYNLGICTLQRQDGTTLYLTRDVAACLQRVEQFGFDRHLYIIGDDQSLHLKRLFKIMELAFEKKEKELQKIGKSHWSKNLVHVSFGKVQGMSTRRGKAVFLEDILDTAQMTMLEKMKSNKEKFEEIKQAVSSPSSTLVTGQGIELSLENLESQQVLQVADKLGISAVIVQDFQAKAAKGYSFDWKRMTDSVGNTGVYLQYAHARLCGIEQKAGVKLNFDSPVGDLLTEPEAFELVNMISMYPEVTRSAVECLEASLIVQYLFGLSHAISSANQVLQVKGLESKGELAKAEARLLLFWSAKVTLAAGMKVLGLEPLERM